MEIEEFIEEIAHVSGVVQAWLTEHLEDNDTEFLPYVFLGTLSDELIRKFQQDSNDLTVFLSIAEKGLINGSNELRELIFTCISETIDSHHNNTELHRKILQLCGKQLRASLLYFPL